MRIVPIVPNEFGSISDLNLRFVTNILYECHTLTSTQELY